MIITDYNTPMYKTGAHAGVLSTTGDLWLYIASTIVIKMH